MDFIDFLDFYYVNVHSEMIFSYCVELDWQNNHTTCMGVVPGDAGGAMAPPDFGRSVTPISTKGGRLCQIILAPSDFQTFRRPCDQYVYDFTKFVLFW